MNDVIKKNGVNFGIIVGVISILMYTLMYIIDIKMFANYWIGIVSFFVNLIIGIVAVAKSKKALGGYISFKESFTVFFIVIVIGLVLGTSFMYILFNFIDPSAKEVIMNEVIEKTVAMMQGLGTPAADMKEVINEMKDTDNFGILAQIKSYVGSLVLYSIIGLIVAAAMKKNKPEFEN